MLVTIISDASHCPDTKAGGYGCWVASNRGCQRFNGPLHNTGDSSEAEAKAACNGVWCAINAGLLKRNDVVLLQLDCVPALQLFTRKRNARDGEREALEWLEKTLATNNIKISYRHVKGHSDKTDNRSVAQQRCDEGAKKHMKLERQRLQCKELKNQIKASNAALVKKEKGDSLSAIKQRVVGKSNFLRRLMKEINSLKEV